MNIWTQMSVDYANQRNYLDELYKVYPIIPEGIREVDNALWRTVESSFLKKDNGALIESLLDLELFPIKDSYVAYFKRDRGALKRNPETVNRLAGRIYEMGLTEIFKKCTEPKETNRQIGPLFRRWLNKKTLGVSLLSSEKFLLSSENAVLDAGDAEMRLFAEKYLGYSHPKGLDFVARFNGKYIIGEAKFLTDFGGHQNAQFQDAIQTLEAKDVTAVKIAILDGVLYIKSGNKMYDFIATNKQKYNIMSSLVLRDFLYQV